jgi:hypothetical protein
MAPHKVFTLRRPLSYSEKVHGHEPRDSPLQSGQPSGRFVYAAHFIPRDAYSNTKSNSFPLLDLNTSFS